MNKRELFENLEALGMRPGRGLGQNFLLDGNLLEYIVRESGAAAGMIVLEVGPGFGALTGKLLAAGAEVYAVEYDRRLAAFLRRKFAGEERFHLTEADACRADIPAILPEGAPFHSIANLPYAISSVFVAKLIELANPPKSCFFMLQKEMAQRLAAEPRTGNYGALSVRAQLHYSMRIARLVPPEVFYPPPAVESALLAAELKPDRPAPELRGKADKVARAAFSQRRKKLTNTLRQLFAPEKITNALKTMGKDLNVRPEVLSPEEFVRLAELLYS